VLMKKFRCETLQYDNTIQCSLGFIVNVARCSSLGFATFNVHPKLWRMHVTDLKW
jgi:hypothetical protein